MLLHQLVVVRLHRIIVTRMMLTVSKTPSSWHAGEKYGPLELFRARPIGNCPVQWTKAEESEATARVLLSLRWQEMYQEFAVHCHFGGYLSRSLVCIPLTGMLYLSSMWN